VQSVGPERVLQGVLSLANRASAMMQASDRRRHKRFEIASRERRLALAEDSTRHSSDTLNNKSVFAMFYYSQDKPCSRVRTSGMSTISERYVCITSRMLLISTTGVGKVKTLARCAEPQTTEEGKWLGTVDVQHHPLNDIDRLGLRDQFPVDCPQTDQVLLFARAVPSRTTATAKSGPHNGPRSSPNRSAGRSILGRRSASFTSSYPASRLYTDCRSRSARGNRVFVPRGSVRCCAMSWLSPSCSSNSRTRIKPPSEVTRAP
jgi:hypothetical protein